MTTNCTNNPAVAEILASANVGTFTGLIVTKQGVTRGKGADKKAYGDDTVHTVIFTGFKYERLVQRSLDMLPSITTEDVIATCAAHGDVVTEADVEAARVELTESYGKTLAGTNESTTDAVFEPLTVDGEIVRGARVYKCVAGTADDAGEPRVCKCRDCTGDAKAPLKGTVYLQGLRVHTTVITPAKNGPAPEPNSAPKTIAKNEITRRLPVSKYVSYRLEKGADWVLRAGGAAVIEATKHGFVVDAKTTDLLAKAA